MKIFDRWAFVLITSYDSPSITEELAAIQNQLKAAQGENEELRKQTSELRQVNEDIQTAMAISEAAKEDEIDAITRKCQEEIASLHHIMKGYILLF